MALSDGIKKSVLGGHKIPHLHLVTSRWLACVSQSVLNTGKCAST